MQLKVYVVVTVGETTWAPEVALVPVQPPDAVQEVALVEFQERVEELPGVTAVGLAERVMVGIDATLFKKSSTDQPSGALS